MSRNGIQIVKRFWVNRMVRVFQFQSEFSRYHESVGFMGLGPHAFERPWLNDVRNCGRFSGNAEPSRLFRPLTYSFTKENRRLQSSEVLERLKTSWDDASARAPIIVFLFLMKFTWKLNVAKKCHDFRENDNWTMLSSTGRLQWCFKVHCSQRL